MPFMQSKLEGIFQSPPVDTEAEAISFMASAFTTFFLDATVAGVPALPSPLAPAEAAMAASLVGMSAPGAAAGLIQAGITSYWATALLSAPAIWIAVPPIVPASGVPPAGLGGVAAAMGPVFASNISGAVDNATASAALASAIFPLVTVGATVTVSPPPAVIPVL